MKYFITYTATDEKIGSNPLWHTALLFSRWDNATDSKVEVIDQYGFYPIPATFEDPTFYGILKRAMGVNIDSQGNHGWLRREKTHELDRGEGLHGVSYEVDEDKFLSLQEKCKQQIHNQSEAIAEISAANHFKEKQGKISIYPYEHRSATIFAIERAKSEDEKRPPRLAKFDLDLSWGLTGPSLAKSNNCKSYVINLLSETLGQEKVARLTEHGQHPTIPRWSGKMEAICLHSRGPLSPHTKANGDIVYFRDDANPEVKLYWSVPPQEIETTSDATKTQLAFGPQYDRQIKPLVSQLQRLERMIDNTPWPINAGAFAIELKERLKSLYEFYALVPVDRKNDFGKPTKGLGPYLINSLFSLASSDDEQLLQAHIKNTQMLFDMIYTVIVDGCETQDNELAGNPKQLTDDELVTVISYFSANAKKSICNILNRSNISPELQESGNSAMSL